MQQRNIFAGPYLDRAAHLRQDPEWFAAALADERSRAIPVWNSRNLIAEGDAPRAAYLELTHIPSERRNSGELVLLGRFGDTNYFTYELESIEPPSLLRCCRSTKRDSWVMRAPSFPGGAGTASAAPAVRRPCPPKADMCSCAATQAAAMSSSRASIRPSSCWSATRSAPSWDAKPPGR